MGKDKEPVLVVGGTGPCVVDADLVVVVFRNVLPQATELESVSCPNLGESVADVINDAAGARRVRAAVKRTEVCKLIGRNLVGNHLGSGSVKIWIIDTVFGTVVKARRCVDVDVDVIRRTGDKGVVDHGGTDGPGVAENTNLVGTIEDARVSIEVAEVRLVVVVVIVQKAEAEGICIVRNEV